MEKKQVTFRLESRLFKDIKHLAVETERSTTDLIVEALHDLLKKYEDKIEKKFK